MKVRDARPADIDRLTDFSLRLGLESEGRAPEAAVVRSAIKAALEDPKKARYFVAEADGIIGSLFVTFEWSDWTGGWYWWIQGAYVVPEARRKGIFKALYQAVHEAARKAGAKRVRLYVHSENTKAIATYHGLGMHEEPYRIFDAPV